MQIVVELATATLKKGLNLQIPDDGAAIFFTANQPLAIGADSEAVNRPPMTRQPFDRLRACGPPEIDTAIGAAGK